MQFPDGRLLRRVTGDVFENREAVLADIRKESVSDRFLADEEIESEFGAADENGVPY